ncbi:MAG: PTS sugar transporter subunit IIA, partial [Desulfurococcaceae archaeon]
MSDTTLLHAFDRRVQIVQSVSNWIEATKLSGILLLKDGCIEEGYIERMVETCRELGPYIAIMPGLAIPHARPEDGAKKLCFSAL